MYSEELANNFTVSGSSGQLLNVDETRADSQITGAHVMDEVRDTIRQFILTTYLPGEAAGNLRDDTPLLTSGILDSLAAVGVVSFIGQHFGVELDVYDTAIERFDRIADIASSIERKRAASGSGKDNGAGR
jgi:acyl carrier protein